MIKRVFISFIIKVYSNAMIELQKNWIIDIIIIIVIIFKISDNIQN